MHDPWLTSQIKAARPQALAALNRYFKDLDLAEDAFQEASVKAIRSWTRETPPRDPAAWLIVTGRNYGIDQIRKRTRETLSAPDDLSPVADDARCADALPEALDRAQFRDDILRLLFTCCHPVLRKEQQVALSLKVVTGLTVDEIARAFLVQPKTMEQRITRAKKRIQAAKLTYEEPDAAQRSKRLTSVANSIYLLFNEGYSASQGSDLIRVTLCEEAIRLTRLLVRLFPGEPELRGLLALCLIQHSRRRARVAQDGAPVLLEHQDRTLWDRKLIAEGHVLLEAALLKRTPGPLQIEAAIAATHTRAKTYDETDWEEIDRLYRALEILRPSPVVTLNRAVVRAKLDGPDEALQHLEALSAPLTHYASYHAVRASLLGDLGSCEAARAAFERALALAGTEAERNHIRARIVEIK